MELAVKTLVTQAAPVAVLQWDGAIGRLGDWAIGRLYGDGFVGHLEQNTHNQGWLRFFQYHLERNFTCHVFKGGKTRILPCHLLRLDQPHEHGFLRCHGF